MSPGHRKRALALLALILFAGVAAGLSLTAAAVAPVLDAAAVFGRANDAYRDGRFGEAAAGYEKLLAAGVETPEILFNLGIARLGQDEVGEAVAAFLRARRVAPRDHVIVSQLELARRAARDDVRPPDPGRAAAALLFWHYKVSPAETAWALAGANLLLWGLLAVGLVLSRRSEAWGAAVVTVALVATALAGSLAVRRLAPTEVAVVAAPEVAARSALGDEAIVRFTLHEGTEVRVRERRDGWLRVSLPEGIDGWIPAETAEVVRR